MDYLCLPCLYHVAYKLNELHKLPQKVLNCDAFLMTPHTWNPVGTPSWGLIAHMSQLTRIPMRVAPQNPGLLWGTRLSVCVGGRGRVGRT